MRFSWEWVCEHVRPGLPPRQAAELLTMHGMTVDEIVEEGADWILDVDITANRPDAMSHRGIARELAAITNTRLLPPDLSFGETGVPTRELCNIEIGNPNDCRRFCARAVRGLRNGPSPQWMVRRLESVGLRSLNLLVDITNYVLWDLGHPLHGYDLATLPEGRIVVRRAGGGESLRLIDGSVRHLDPEVLVIADRERAIGLAGVMGGFDTEIGERTDSILLEAAWFDPGVVRRGARRMELSTDASYRFERGADIDGPAYSVDRCCHFFESLAGGSVCRGVVDVYPGKREPATVCMDGKRLSAFAGAEIGEERVSEIFAALELPAERREGRWHVRVPTHRVDIEREADLFEEVVRIVGFGNIPPTLPHVDLPPGGPNPLSRLVAAAESSLLAAGFDEVLIYDFIDPEGNALFAPPDGGRPIAVLNPIAAPQMSVMRQSLAPGLMATLRHNFNRGRSGLRIFEIARIFLDTPEGPAERTTAGYAADAAEGRSFWHGALAPVDFYDLKGVTELIFTRLGLDDIMIRQGTAGFLDPTARADLIRDGRKIGWLGRAGAAALALYDLPHPVLIGQVDLEALVVGAFPEPRFRRVSRYPSVSRDLSFTLGRETAYTDVLSAVRSSGVEDVVGIRLLDLYRGEATSGRMSMTVRVTFQSMDRTLTQEEVDRFDGRIRESLRGLEIEFR